ncbi:unnamed protein product [Oikopleura dioica]|uniref:C3H1-type domain-containing protein n=1 Tax=Oikopleura dioica TaxID=34765 RepID=E4Y8J8_OIKDI|nr:unnamed protein product [Oikopleura dioica]
MLISRFKKRDDSAAGEIRMAVFGQMNDEIGVQHLRQLGRQLLEEPAAVLNQLSEPLNQLRQSIENVKSTSATRHSGLGSPLGGIIRENYDGEQLEDFSDDATTLLGGSCAASQNSVEDDEDMIEMVRNRGRSMSTPGPLYGTKFNTSRYKTEMCQRFTETGECRFMDKCQFAHGIEQLRQVSKHPKFKTIPCKTFHQTGICSYGTRCNFLHNERPEQLESLRIRQKADRRLSVPTVPTIMQRSLIRTLSINEESESIRLPAFRRLSLSEC